MKQEIKLGLKKGLLFLVIINLFVLVFSAFFTINRTASLPTGIYFLYSYSELKKGDIVVFLPVEAAKDYLPKNTKYMMKEIQGMEGDEIKIVNNVLYINDENFGKVFETDITGKKLPRTDIKEIPKGEVFLVTRAEGSFDSRYWGTLKEDKIHKKAKLIIQF